MSAVTVADPRRESSVMLRSDEEQVAAVRIGERERSLLPVWVGRLDGLLTDPLSELGDRSFVVEVEHEQVLRVRLGGAMLAARGELEVGVGARKVEEHAVVAIVVGEPPELGQPNSIAVGRHDRIEVVGVPGNTYVHDSVSDSHTRSRRGMPSISIGG